MKRNFFAANLIVILAAICMSVTVHADEIKVVPIGKTVGVKMYTDGLLVIGTSDVNGENIAKKCGIKVNDRITKINGNAAESTMQLADMINENPQGVTLSVERDNQNIEINAVPAQTSDNVYRLGLWVRDSTAGIGTVTYYDPSTKSFAALGHAINDVDTGNILSLKSGNILDCTILSVTKSKIGMPGEINGSFGDESLGEIGINSQVGIFGKTDSEEFSNNKESVAVAAKSQIHEGDAYILTDAFGKNTEKYSIKIEDITDEADKGLVIEITDDRLKDFTGGIVQGMSGSPIIQDDRLVGAVTHVFVNNPTKGYGALAESMIDMTNKL